MVGYKDTIYVFGGEVGFSNGVETPLWKYNIAVSQIRNLLAQCITALKWVALDVMLNRSYRYSKTTYSRKWKVVSFSFSLRFIFSSVQWMHGDKLSLMHIYWRFLMKVGKGTLGRRGSRRKWWASAYLLFLDKNSTRSKLSLLLLWLLHMMYTISIIIPYSNFKTSNPLEHAK